MKTELLELAKQMENPINHHSGWRHAWATQLRELAARPSGEVTDAMVGIALAALDADMRRQCHKGTAPYHRDVAMRAALEAALQLQPKDQP